VFAVSTLLRLLGRGSVSWHVKKPSYDLFFRKTIPRPCCDYERPRRDHFSIILRLDAIQSDQAMLWNRSSIFREDFLVKWPYYRWHGSKCSKWSVILSLLNVQLQQRSNHYLHLRLLFDAVGTSRARIHELPITCSTTEPPWPERAIGKQNIYFVRNHWSPA
jgi:hypothetical protein